MFKLQHQFNNIVQTTQLTNDQMPQFHCHCESVNRQLQAPTLSFAEFEKSFAALSIGPCGRLPQIISWPAVSSVGCALCMLACRSARRWTRWAADDCFKKR